MCSLWSCCCPWIDNDTSECEEDLNDDLLQTPSRIKEEEVDLPKRVKVTTEDNGKYVTEITSEDVEVTLIKNLMN